MEWKEYIKNELQNYPNTRDLLRHLMEQETYISMFSALKLVDDSEFAESLPIEPITKDIIRSATRKLHLKSFHAITGWVHTTFDTHKCSFGNKYNKPIHELSLDEFTKFTEAWKAKQNKAKERRRASRQGKNSAPLYIKYEYGLSDW